MNRWFVEVYKGSCVQYENEDLQSVMNGMDQSHSE